MTDTNDNETPEAEQADVETDTREGDIPRPSDGHPTAEYPSEGTFGYPTGDKPEEDPAPDDE